jgi:hypothetical protein
MEAVCSSEILTLTGLHGVISQDGHSVTTKGREAIYIHAIFLDTL